MRTVVLTLISCMVFIQLSFAQKNPKATEVWEPQPRKVNTNKKNGIPSDAIVLFDGINLDEWKSTNTGTAAGWKIEGNHMTVVKGTGNIQTKRTFGDVQLHLEWRTPTIIEGEGQGRGNSGVFFQERYEVQVLDNYNNKTYANGQAGSIYKQYLPLVNVCKAPGEWQTYDIIFTAPRFNKDGIKTASGYLTVIHNGVLIQNHVEIKGTTEYIGQPQNDAHGNASIMLQDHSNPISYRNIWVREL